MAKIKSLRIQIAELLAGNALDDVYTEVLEMQSKFWGEYAKSFNSSSSTKYAKKRINIYAKLADKILNLIKENNA